MNITEYLEVLKESLKKKESVLQSILEACNRQTVIAEQTEFNMDDFQLMMDQKESLLEQLEELDQGFDQVFDKIKSVLKENIQLYDADINTIRELIHDTTDLGVDIQRVEEKNRRILEKIFSGQKRDLRQIKTSTKVASTYYKTMSNAHSQDPYFMDQKK